MLVGQQNSITLIIKTTHNCNLGCDYCFYTKSVNPSCESEIDISAIKIILTKSSQRWDKVNVVFHGGEPLLQPVAFFREIINIESSLSSRHGTTFINSVQSNGTIYTDEQADFLKSNCIGLGISLDGTREIHDRTRPFKNSRIGSYNTIIENIQKYRSKGINPSAIVVITSKIAKQPMQIYDQFKLIKLDFKVNELVPEKTPQELVPTQEQMAGFYISLFDRWFADQSKPTLRIRPLTGIVASFWKHPISDCTFRSNCSQYLAVETNGDVYVCGRFTHIPSQCLGNILTNTWDAILSNKTIVRFVQRQSHLPEECIKCEWYKHCFGGCAACALVAKGNLYQKTLWCESRKVLFVHVKRKLSKMLKEG